MTLRLLSVQVVKFWDLIKYALGQVEKIGSDEELEVYNRLFAALLSDKAQCFIVFDGGEEVRAVCVTELRYDELRATKSLHIRCLYAFKAASNEVWIKEFEAVKEMAKREGCSRITFETSNPRIKSIAKDIGAVEISTNLKVEVGV